MVIKNSKLVTRNFIALVGPNDEKIFTNDHKYIGSPNHRIKRYTDDGNNRADFIVKFLNYAYFEESIKKLTNLNVSIVCKFFNKYYDWNGNKGIDPYSLYISADILLII